MSKLAEVGSKRVCTYYGYIWVKVAGHPSFKDGWVKEHHLVWFKKHKTVVSKGFILHHRDHDKQNNRLRNLKLMPRAAHAAEHHRGAKRSEEVKITMRIKAQARCTQEWRLAVSERVKQQHADGKFGRQTWKGV
jgi:hypothetical protein